MARCTKKLYFADIRIEGIPAGLSGPGLASPLAMALLAAVFMGIVGAAAARPLAASGTGSGAVGCMDESNNAVDWWITMKHPNGATYGGANPKNLTFKPKP